MEYVKIAKNQLTVSRCNGKWLKFCRLRLKGRMENAVGSLQQQWNNYSVVNFFKPNLE